MLKSIIIDCLSKVKAKNVLSYNMRGYSPFYDEMIIASVDVERQATAVIGYVEEELNKAGFKIRSVEGANTSWVLVDCYDIVVSIFTSEERNHFALEKLYLEFPCENISFNI